jgi:hypothetical protein
VVERRRLAQAPVVMLMSPRALEPLPAAAWPASRVIVPCPVEPSGTGAAVRDVDVLTYAGNPVKRRLGVVLDAWARARRGSETLVVAGITRAGLGVRAPEGVEVAGRLDPGAYRALLRRARVFVAAPEREDYGIAPLEALADGCMLVSAVARGPYPALELARSLDPRLVGGDLAAQIRTALDDPLPGYAARAGALLEPYARASVDQTLIQEVLPRLL